MFPNLFGAATFVDTMKRKPYRPKSQKGNTCTYSTYQAEASSKSKPEADERREDEEREPTSTYKPWRA